MPGRGDPAVGSRTTAPTTKRLHSHTEKRQRRLPSSAWRNSECKQIAHQTSVESSCFGGRRGSTFGVMERHPLLGHSGSAAGTKNGHVHWLNRHTPELAWMNSTCWHQAQGLTDLASGSIQRTAN
jgi:hypothetical protein